MQCSSNVALLSLSALQDNVFKFSNYLDTVEAPQD